MNRKIVIGLSFGTLAGVIDVMPMIIQGLTWDANISAFCFWIITGFLIATSTLSFNSALKGILISFITIIPLIVLIGWQEPFTLIPILTMNIVLGGLLGYSINKFIPAT